MMLRYLIIRREGVHVDNCTSINDSRHGRQSDDLIAMKTWGSDQREMDFVTAQYRAASIRTTMLDIIIYNNPWICNGILVVVTIDLFFRIFFLPFFFFLLLSLRSNASQKIVANGKDRFVIGSNKREDRCIDEYDSRLIFYSITRVSRNVVWIDILVCIKIFSRFFRFFFFVDAIFISSGIINLSAQYRSSLDRIKIHSESEVDRYFFKTHNPITNFSLRNDSIRNETILRSTLGSRSLK